MHFLDLVLKLNFSKKTKYCIIILNFIFQCYFYDNENYIRYEIKKIKKK